MQTDRCLLQEPHHLFTPILGQPLPSSLWKEQNFTGLTQDHWAQTLTTLSLSCFSLSISHTHSRCLSLSKQASLQSWLPPMPSTCPSQSPWLGATPLCVQMPLRSLLCLPLVMMILGRGLCILFNNCFNQFSFS